MESIFVIVVATLSGISVIIGLFMGKKFEESTLAPAIAIVDMMMAILGAILVVWLRILGTSQAYMTILLGLMPFAALLLGIFFRRVGRGFMNRVAATY